MAESLYLLSGQTETFGDQIVPDTDDCFLAPADVSAYSSHVSVVCFFQHSPFSQNRQTTCWVFGRRKIVCVEKVS